MSFTFYMVASLGVFVAYRFGHSVGFLKAYKKAENTYKEVLDSHMEIDKEQAELIKKQSNTIKDLVDQGLKYNQEAQYWYNNSVILSQKLIQLDPKLAEQVNKQKEFIN